MSNALYDIITDKIVKMLDKGEIPCRKPWAVKAVNAALPRLMDEAWVNVTRGEIE